MKDLLERLTAIPGVSGREDEVRRAVQELVRPYADEVKVDALGNLIVHKAGPGPRLVLAAHMDEIGLLVSEVDERGFLRFVPVGALGPAWRWVGAQVALTNGVTGVVGMERVDEVKDLRWSQLFIDIGAVDAGEARTLTGGTGEFASSVPSFAQVGRRRVAAKALDDRAGCALLVRLLQEVQEVPNDLVVVFTVQEEVGQRGARTAAWALNPAVCVAVDVTPAGDTPECERRTVRLGQGPAVKVVDSGLVAHPQVRELLLQTAAAQGIPHQREVLEGGTTDAGATQIVLAGVPSGAVSLPCRYVHSGAEMIDLDDLEKTYDLLQALARTPLADRF